MARLRVWFKSGSKAEWELHEEVDVKEFADFFRDCLKDLDPHFISFSTKSKDSSSSGVFGWTYLRSSDIEAAEIDGFLDLRGTDALWAELRPHADSS